MSTREAIIAQIIKQILNLQDRIIRDIIRLRWKKYDLFSTYINQIWSTIVKAKQKLQWTCLVGNDQIVLAPAGTKNIYQFRDALSINEIDIDNYVNKYNVSIEFSNKTIIDLIDRFTEGLAHALETFYLSEDYKDVLPSTTVVLSSGELQLQDLEPTVHVPMVNQLVFENNDVIEKLDSFKVLGSECALFGVYKSDSQSFVFITTAKHVFSILDYAYAVASFKIVAKTRRPSATTANLLQSFLDSMGISLDTAIIVMTYNAKIRYTPELGGDGWKCYLIDQTGAPLQISYLDDPMNALTFFDQNGYLQINPDDHIDKAKLVSSLLGVYLILYHVGTISELPEQVIPNFSYYKL